MCLVSVGVVLSQPRTQLSGIEPAMGCDSGPPLNINWMGRPTSYRAALFTGKYRMDVGQNRRWWWNN